MAEKTEKGGEGGMRQETKIWIRIIRRTAKFFLSLLDKWERGDVKNI